MIKPLALMTEEIVENNTRLGWYGDADRPVATFPEAMALLHSEVSEALEVWRVWGTQDGTYHDVDLGAGSMQGGPPKPQGVGSEFADILIRLLDDVHLFGQLDGLEKALDRAGYLAISDSFPDNMNTLHNLICMADLSFEDTLTRTLEDRFASILVFLRQLCEQYGVDLETEYERKMAFNRTRPYRHGNKRI